MSQAYHVTGELTDSQHLRLDEPVPLPAGKVRVVVEEFAASNTGAVLTADDASSDTPEAIEAWIRWFDALESVEFTEAERAARQAARQEEKQFELDQWQDRSRRLEEHFR